MKTLFTKYKILFTVLFLLSGNYSSAQCSLSFDTDTTICLGSAVDLGAIANVSGPGIVYDWSPGTGLSCTDCSNPIAAPVATTTYSLTITASNGCTQTETITVTIEPDPVAGFNFLPNNVCATTPIQFSSTSTGSGLSYSWNFGNPASGGQNTSNQQNPSHTFISTGSASANFNVVLTVTNSFGCQDAISQIVTVNQIPDASLIDPISLFKNCDGSNFNLTVYDNSLVTGLNHTIIWGDGSPNYTSATAPTAGTSHLYTTSDIFDLDYIITGANGCSDTASYLVSNITNPAIGAANPGATSGCGPLVLCFPLSSYSANHPSTYYVVDYGDSSPNDTLPHPPPAVLCHTYSESSCGQAGNSFTFSIQAINQCDISEASISPIRVYTGPTANFTTPQTNYCINTAVPFTNLSTLGFNASCATTTLFTWDFGDGSAPLTAFTLTNPTHVYTVPGTYTVTLSATNNCATTTHEEVICIEEPPVPDFIITPDTACVPFIAITTNLSSLLNTCDVDTLWNITFIQSACIPGTGNGNFTNGTNNTSENPEFLITNPGEYNVRLNLTNSCGTFFHQQIVLGQAPPQVILPALASVCEGESVNPTATVNDCYEPSDSYLWTFAGGTPASSTNLVPGLVSYTSAGSYTVAFEATNACGTTNATTPITIFAPPVADAGPDVSSCSNVASSIGSAPVGGVTYSWAPATGLNNASIANPTVTLSNVTGAPVDYMYVVTASTSANCFTRDTVIVTVFPLPTLAVNSPAICIGANTNLLVTGAGVGGSYVWAPGTNLSCTNCDNPTADPISTTSYTITGTTAEGCVNTTTTAVTVNPLPAVNAGPDLTLCDQPVAETLNGTPAGGTWSGSPNLTAGGIFTPNGTESSSLVYSYTNPATNCSSSDTLLVVVNPLIVPTVDPLDSICLATPLTDLNALFNSNPVGGVWTGTGVTTPNFNPVTAGVGTHTLTYTLGTSTCEASVTADIIVHANPVLATSDETICFGDDVQLNVSGAGAGGTYSWSPLTALTCSDCDNPIANPTATTIYTITGTTIQGCSSDITSTVTVNPLPVVNAGVDMVLCDQPIPVVLNGTPSGGTWTGSPNVTAGGTFTPNGNEVANLIYSYTDGVTNCSSSDTMVITVSPPITATLDPTDSICINSLAINLNTQFNPSTLGGTWSGTGVSNPNFNPATAGIGTHTLTYTLGSGTCQTTSTTDIIVNPQPTIVSANETICFGDAVQLGATGAGIGGSYDWLPATNLTCTNCDNPIANPTTTTTYTITGTSAQGCSNTATSTVTVNPLPIVDAGIDTTICNFPVSVQLTGTPSGGVWSGPNVTPTGEFTPSGVGNFTVTYTVTLGTSCVDSDDRIVTILDPTLADAGPDLEACVGSPIVVLNGTPAGGDWTGSFVTLSGDFAPSTSGVYDLIYSTGTGNCLTIDSMIFTVHALPAVDAGTDVGICISEGAFDLVGNPLGGVWSGTGITDVNLGTFDPAIAAVGTHTITYTIIDPITTCVNQDNVDVIVNPLPVVDFTVDSLICVNTAVTFTNNSTLIFNSDWTFGDGGISAVTSPNHTYTATGLYDITLIVTTVNGCVDSVSKSVSVLDFPNAQYTLLPAVACGPVTASFTNTSTGIANTYDWDFGNGVTSNLQDPLDVTYVESQNADTVYTIELTATNYCGVDTHTETITVEPTPTAIFGTDFDSGCSPFEVNIANTSIGSADTYYWDFGDGTTSTISSPLFQHTYYTGSTPTSYTITLIAENNCGSDTTTYVVTATPILVDAFFNTSVVSGCAPLTVDFTQYTLGGTQYSWNFDDGNISNVYSPTHSFVAAGTYNVSLSANDGCGYDTTTVVITVHPAPNIDFTSNPASVCVNEPFNFVNLSTGISGVTWDFGDGTSSNLIDPTHAYSTSGTFTVSLSGTSATFGCPASISHTVTVDPTPIAAFTATPQNGCMPLDVQFTNNSMNANFYFWDFGDGNTSNVLNPSHSYPVAGTYTIRLIVENLNGCSDTTYEDVIVYPLPTVDFAINQPSVCLTTGNVSFTNLSTGAVGYTWDFGNGQSSVLTSPSTTYTMAGTYTVTLTGVNQYGCLNTQQRTLNFYDFAVASYTLPESETCLGNSLNFNSTSSNSSSVEWLFGNTESVFGTNVDYEYPTAGNYTVTMIAYGGGGCNDTLTITPTITINPTPVADFNYENVIEINQWTGLVDFFNLSTFATNYQWYFGDGGSGTAVNPSHSYLTHGDFYVTLIASNNFGCADTIIKPIIVELYKGLYLANAMYPGHSDYNVSHFVPIGVGLKEFELLIFDDWGNLIWSTTALDANGRPTEAWDGTFNGAPVQQDAYVWKVNAVFLDDSLWEGKEYAKNKIKKSGTVTVIR